MTSKSPGSRPFTWVTLETVKTMRFTCTGQANWYDDVRGMDRMPPRLGFQELSLCVPPKCHFWNATHGSPKSFSALMRPVMFLKPTPCCLTHIAEILGRAVGANCRYVRLYDTSRLACVCVRTVLKAVPHTGRAERLCSGRDNVRCIPDREVCSGRAPGVLWACSGRAPCSQRTWLVGWRGARGSSARRAGRAAFCERH